eukprot:EC825392.1.p1 GENE.EC825392.1~~EC825392.1.p1  ORF type:complete len:206 (-),score=80.17 EC825392.1:35-652(-)
MNELIKNEINIHEGSFAKFENIINKEECIENVDIIVNATGVIPNTEFLKSNFNSSLDNNGYININNNFQLLTDKSNSSNLNININNNEEYYMKNILSFGSCVNIMKEKYTCEIWEQKKVLIKNLKKLEANEKLVNYKCDEKDKGFHIFLHHEKSVSLKGSKVSYSNYFETYLFKTMHIGLFSSIYLKKGNKMEEKNDNEDEENEE